MQQKVLIIEDDGIGIPDDKKALALQPFVRLDESRNESTGGTGLGLSIVKHAVQACGAKVSLESQPGEGTTMRVLFRES